VLFGLTCVAVIVMRESRIDSYKPGFRTPLYPWVPIGGVLIAIWLVTQMGLLAILFTIALLIGCVAWYRHYGSNRVRRRGAIFHVHQRLGEQRYDDLERELLTIINDRTQSENLSYEALITRCATVVLPQGTYDDGRLRTLLRETAVKRFAEGRLIAATVDGPLPFRPVGHGIHLSITVVDTITQPELIVCRFGEQATLDLEQVGQTESTHTLLVLVAPPNPVGLDLRLGGHITEVVQSTDFTERWIRASNEKALNAVLMRDDHFYHGPVETMPFLVEQLGRTVGELDLPPSCIVALIERDGELIIPTRDVTLLAFDGVSIIGEPADIELLNELMDPFELQQAREAAERAATLAESGP
jgi:hypothetical protein